ncbi:probable methyltransferase TARBP1 isoform X2 [Chelonus insularis]|uniref:probable methyltransferase TARBP1 isoform X2 n=1 Tax=Chelonus insularis TaxID=460826 RepID=UPI00158AFEBC|nr:probable methyltransferase TARBP1 isoform X2 [Chelonus insularis]
MCHTQNDTIKTYSKHDDWEKPLTLLCTMIDNMLSLPSDAIIHLNISYCNNQNKLWQLIKWGITSKKEQNCKQALYIFKIILNFIEEHRMIPFEPKIVPFVYCPQYDQQSSLKRLRDNFFLILESLEEKQAHLITPILKNLEDLIQFSIDHVSCNNCLDSKWIACIIKRLLDHKTSLIIKSGVLSLLKINPNFFTEELLILLLKGLNNTFLYSNPTLNSLPIVVEELSKLFVLSEYNGIDLINRFIFTASEISWTPIPLYYNIFSLQNAAKQIEEVKYNIFTDKELNLFTDIIQKSFKIFSYNFRQLLLDNVLTIFLTFARKPLNLKSLASFFMFYTENPKIYSNDVVNYFSKNITKDHATQYLSEHCKKISSTELVNEADIWQISTMLIILQNAQLIFNSYETRKMVNEVFQLIIDADVRPYIDKNQCLNVTQFINVLFKTNQRNLENDPHKLSSLIIPYFEFIKKLISKNLRHSAYIQSFTEVKIYVECFDTISKFYKSMKTECTLCTTIGREAIQYLDSSYDKFENMKNIKYWFQLKIAVLYLDMKENIDYEFSSKNYQEFLKKMIHRKLDTSEKSNSDCDNGKIISDCYELTGQLFEQLMNKMIASNYLGVDNVSSLLECDLEKFIEIGKEFVISPIMKALHLLLKKNYSFMCTLILKSDTINSIIDTAFNYLWDLKRDELYWSSLNSLLQLILDDNFFKIPECQIITLKHMKIVTSQSQNVLRIKDLLIENLKNNLDTSTYFHDILISNYLDANLGENDNKIRMQIYNYILNQRQCLFQNDYVDLQFRAKSITIYMKILHNITNYNDIKNILLFLISKLKKYENKRYFENSSIHKIKHRVMQLLLLLLRYLRQEETKMLHDFIGNLIISESNQLTVRMMQEWLLIKIYLNNFEMQPLVWELLERSKCERPGSIVSIASIIYHVSRGLSFDKQIVYIEVAISTLFSSCLSQKFVVRLYCQVILDKILDMIPSHLLSNDYKLIKKGIKDSMLHGNLKKNSLKLSDDFYFTSFDPIKNFTIETIFYEVPRLLRMATDECIKQEILRSVDLKYITIPMRNVDNKLSSLEPTVYSLKNQNEGFEDLIQNDTIEIDICDTTTIQKKPMPWKSIIPIDDDSFRFSTMRQEKLANDDGMIVVASLIDGMPNLGGLARTAEIFGIREIIIESLNYVENKEFQTLSVSADKWIKITEVKVHNLKNFLSEKSSMGWALVGAEQTNNSVNLHEMEFKKKTILILGNEKKGIPSDLIPLLDVCVEIPQTGVIRSLNVHITGAICMWQYAQQHIF